jgi:hypothetical protein
MRARPENLDVSQSSNKRGFNAGTPVRHGLKATRVALLPRYNGSSGTFFTAAGFAEQRFSIQDYRRKTI